MLLQFWTGCQIKRNRSELGIVNRSLDLVTGSCDGRYNEKNKSRFEKSSKEHIMQYVLRSLSQTRHIQYTVYRRRFATFQRQRTKHANCPRLLTYIEAFSIIPSLCVQMDLGAMLCLSWSLLDTLRFDADLSFYSFVHFFYLR